MRAKSINSPYPFHGYTRLEMIDQMDDAIEANDDHFQESVYVINTWFLL